MCKKTTFLAFHLSVEIDLVEVVYYFKQLFYLLYDKSVTPAEALLYLPIIIHIVV